MSTPWYIDNAGSNEHVIYVEAATGAGGPQHALLYTKQQIDDEISGVHPRPQPIRLRAERTAVDDSEEVEERLRTALMEYLHPQAPTPAEPLIEMPFDGDAGVPHIDEEIVTGGLGDQKSELTAEQRENELFDFRAASAEATQENGSPDNAGDYTTHANDYVDEPHLQPDAGSKEGHIYPDPTFDNRISIGITDGFAHIQYEPGPAPVQFPQTATPLPKDGTVLDDIQASMTRTPPRTNQPQTPRWVDQSFRYNTPQSLLPLRRSSPDHAALAKEAGDLIDQRWWPHAPKPYPDTPAYHDKVTAEHNVLRPEPQAGIRDYFQPSNDAPTRLYATPAHATTATDNTLTHVPNSLPPTRRSFLVPNGPMVGKPIPNHVMAVVNSIRAMCPNHGTMGDCPKRDSLKKPEDNTIRAHFAGGTGILRKGSSLQAFKGDERLFSEQQWEFLTMQKKRAPRP